MWQWIGLILYFLVGAEAVLLTYRCMHKALVRLMEGSIRIWPSRWVALSYPSY